MMRKIFVLCHADAPSGLYPSRRRHCLASVVSLRLDRRLDCSPEIRVEKISDETSREGCDAVDDIQPLPALKAITPFKFLYAAAWRYPLNIPAIVAVA
jgi:hypothetical protein